jgi:hypothetical protein
MYGNVSIAIHLKPTIESCICAGVLKASRYVVRKAPILIQSNLDLMARSYKPFGLLQHLDTCYILP